jgi:integral membrane protein (TIGR01906 family)
MKTVRIIAHWIFILTLPVLLLATSIRIAANSAELYRYGFNKYDISEETGLSTEELNKVITGLISYFNSGEEYIRLTVTKDGKTFTLFNERETGHLKDVKALFKLDYRLLTGTFIYAFIYVFLCFIFRKEKQMVIQGLIWGSGLTLALLAAIGLMVLVDFNWFFYQFHLISFANDLWLLDPTTDYLIMLFPQGFWLDATLFVAFLTVAMALILGGSGWWRLRKEKKAEKA